MSEKENTLEAIDPEILSALNTCKEPYLKRIILQIINYNPEIKDSVKELIAKISNNQKNDNINKLVVSASFPRYPEHYRLSDFNPACLSEEDQEKYKRLSKLSFLYGKDKPNVLLYGLSDLGREKVAIGLGDACCRDEKEVFYITYNKFADIMRLHCGKPKPNKIYSSLLKSNCLIIDKFAEQTLYDESLLGSMTQQLEERTNSHLESYILHKRNPEKPFVPKCTIITSSFQPVDWTNNMVQDPKKTYLIARLFYQNYATTIHIDETNMPEK